MNNSIWTENMDLPTFGPLEKDLQTEVLILGGGMAGLLCAYKLEQEGVDYALIEADRICHGVSRNTTAKLSSQHGLIYHKLLKRFGAEKARSYWLCQEAAIREYRALAEGIDCDFREQESYIYSTMGTDRLVQEWQALQELGIPSLFATDLPLPFPTAGALCFREQAQFHPLRFAAAIAKGLRIYEHTAAKAFEGNTVCTDRGRIQARRIIVATHFPILNKHGGYFLKLYQDRSYVLALRGASLERGMYLAAEEGGISLRSYGDILLVGGGSHRTGKTSQGWKPLEDFAQKYYPSASIAARWATQDCMSLDGMPYIGSYSKGTPDLFVATGFNKWGMSNSMVAAKLLCDLVQGRENPYEKLFAPSRSLLQPQLLRNGTEAVLHLLMPRTPRCPHMGCALSWNPQEHSWDCPCHGSRFSREGQLLDNPATGDLRVPRKKQEDFSEKSHKK